MVSGQTLTALDRLSPGIRWKGRCMMAVVRWVR